MLFDLRKKIMLMIKDMSELVQTNPFRSRSMEVITSDWEMKGCPFSGVGEVQVILAQFL